MAKEIVQISFDFEDKNKFAEKPLKTISKRGRKPIKTISELANTFVLPDDDQLFSKQYYSMGEVASMFCENQSLIRNWTNEFDILQPRKNRKGDRYFRPEDIKNLAIIYELIRKKKYTLEGAKDYLKRNTNTQEHFSAIQQLEKIKLFLIEIKASL